MSLSRGTSATSYLRSHWYGVRPPSTAVRARYQGPALHLGEGGRRVHLDIETEDVPAEIARAALRDPSWASGFGAAPFDAVLTATALHWLTDLDLLRTVGFARSRPGLAQRGRCRLRGVTLSRMNLDDLGRIASRLPGVRERQHDGRRDWRYHGRLVARQLTGDQVVIRSDFDARDMLLRTFPDTFSVPPRFTRHMMVVADLVAGNSEAIEDAIRAAWRLQSDQREPNHQE